MDKALIFDTGPIISFTMNNLIWLLKPLKDKFNGEFFITKGVEHELIYRPLETKKYKFEALQLIPLINQGLLNVIDSHDIKLKANEIIEIANNTFFAYGKAIKIVHMGEMEVVAAALLHNAKAIVIDERTTRQLVEEPENVAQRLGRKLHTKIETDENNLKKLRKLLSGLKVIRSFELAIVAFELGLFDEMTSMTTKYVEDTKEAVLEGVLWGLKLNGCSVRNDDIESVMKLELKK